MSALENLSWIILVSWPLYRPPNYSWR